MKDYTILNGITKFVLLVSIVYCILILMGFVYASVNLSEPVKSVLSILDLLLLFGSVKAFIMFDIDSNQNQGAMFVGIMVNIGFLIHIILLASPVVIFLELLWFWIFHGIHILWYSFMYFRKL